LKGLTLGFNDEYIEIRFEKNHHVCTNAKAAAAGSNADSFIRCMSSSSRSPDDSFFLLLYFVRGSIDDVA